MADSREPTLQSQAINAAMFHKQAETAPSAAQLRQIIAFEKQICVAQSADVRGGLLDETLGPEKLSAATSGLLRSYRSRSRRNRQRTPGVVARFSD
jgi:hypothetical protein